ncbi:Myb-like DNA-binding domain containing protein [Tritrichomonas foetus]|uniref:Myb-like DNA-binding domain containing protein n=1 Tax=Tritrichomonas foetus TaxID=1144522 RepID=A0A1J4JB38_9EUKA|nr:Myb-like DNA-binding domain containing protein [Tritrichomonas foetus]|eukprot:OHS96390.1 Myb-like DNA-binding domain containing protein [Tritrichomonas foetus]
MSTEKIDALAPTRARHKVSNKSKNTKWSSEEDALLIQLMNEKPNTNWSEYVHYFPGKTGQQVAERWEKVLNPALIKGSWTREEDETIIEFVKQYGTKNWTKLATLLPGRIGKQCRERWRNHLDPDVNRDPWTEEEDNILIEMHEKIGNQWVKIAEYLPGRSDNSIKNRWNSTLKKRLECLRTGTPRKRRGRPSHSNAPKSADDVPRPPKFEEVVSTIKTASPVKAATLNLLSPFAFPAARSPFCLKSPFSLMSPMKDTGFGSWSPTNTSCDLESLGNFSPSPFSPSLSSMNGENKDIMNLLSPMFKR